MSDVNGLHHHIMTVGDVGKLAGVSPRTVCKWVDGGKLPGWRIPGKAGTKGDRRMMRTDVLAFMARIGVPLPGDAVVIAGAGAAVHRLWPKALRAACPMTLVRLASSVLPRACVLGFSRAEMLHAGPLMREWFPVCQLIALLPDDCVAGPEWAAAGFDACLHEPWLDLPGLLS